MNHSPVVRAVDVGYGHVKFTDGRDPESNDIRTDSIPSQSPAALVQVQKGGRGESSFAGAVVMRSRDTFRVPVGDRTYAWTRVAASALLPERFNERLKFADNNRNRPKIKDADQ